MTASWLGDSSRQHAFVLIVRLLKRSGRNRALWYQWAGHPLMFRSHALKTRESLIAPRLGHINRNTT